MPCSANASTHARACASLLSTSVPSTSRITAAAAPFAIWSPFLFFLVLVVHLLGFVQFFVLVRDPAHVVAVHVVPRPAFTRSALARAALTHPIVAHVPFPTHRAAAASVLPHPVSLVGHRVSLPGAVPGR